jgi:exosortase/archaeosortase family protein
MTRFGPSSLTAAGFALGSLILAIEPLNWLVGTWLDPSYLSSGVHYLALIGVLLAWSLSSPVVNLDKQQNHLAILLLILSAITRLVSQVLAINVIGGIALAIDVFALCTLMRTGQRARALSPIWLSALFLFTLPVERILQRVVGYPMQEISAKLSCGGLDIFFENLSCSGIRIVLQGRDVLVDLPCSGTAGLMLIMAFLVTLNAIYRPRVSVAVLWFFVAFWLSIAGNALRIGLLAIGIAFQEDLAGIDVMAPPLHDIIGYLTLGLSLAPIAAFYKPGSAPARSYLARCAFPVVSNTVRHLGVLVFLALVLVIILLPRHALDVSASTDPQKLPFSLAGEIGVSERLLPVEQRYFEQFGGHAQKRRYGSLAVTLVHTSSPLRHLHAPDDCLRGLGYDVEFLGTRFEPVPTALFRARASSGEAWQVAVTYTSSAGHMTNNIAEAIWLWLKKPNTSWTSIQRITPWTLSDGERVALETAVNAALDLSSTKANEG